jgi:hypothetical protein
MNSPNTLEHFPARVEVSPPRHFGLRVACWAVTLALGAAQAWATRFTMNPDGVSYLDIGDAYWRGDWHNAINAYWSPLYSWILGFFLKVVKPTPYWEYPLVHLVNFLIYVGTLVCFEFFLSEFVNRQRQRDLELSTHASTTCIPDWTWRTLGYALFIWTTLLVSLGTVTPDLCVTAFFYLDAALLLRSRRKPTTANFCWFGISLGIGYLAKSILLPLGLVFLVASTLSGRSLRRSLVATSAFILFAAPFVLAISIAKHRLTIGDSGPITYAAYIDGVQPWYPGDGGTFLPEGIGHAEDVDLPSESAKALAHPANKIFDNPASYDFSRHLRGTYSFWYDVSYWQEGIKPVARLHGQIRVLEISLLEILFLVASLSYQLPITVGLLVLFFIAPSPSHCFRRVFKSWDLALPVTAGFLLYATVHFEYRYVAPFICLGWLVMFSGVELPDTKGLRSFVPLLILLVAFEQVASGAANVGASVAKPSHSDPCYWQAAEALSQRGFKQGDKLALISAEPWGRGGPFVARLLKLQIVAQVNTPAAFWSQPSLTQSLLLSAAKKTGARAVLSWGGNSPPAGWKKLGETDYFIYEFANTPG